LNGSFNCPLFSNRTLQPGEIIYATDACFDPIRIGANVVIGQPPAVPLLSQGMIVMLTLTLGAVGMLGLRRLYGRRS
jgi:hypothetical protein